MALMMHAAADAVKIEKRVGLSERCLRAAEIYWQIDNLCVAMPIIDSIEGRELRGFLQALGLTVFNGIDNIPCDESDYFFQTEQSVVLVFHSRDWRSRSAREKSQAAREVFPKATICVVTGMLSVPESSFYPSQPSFTDARALLQAAGIGFFSIEGAHNELSA
jgi:hypothetical protein